MSPKEQRLDWNVNMMLCNILIIYLTTPQIYLVTISSEVTVWLGADGVRLLFNEPSGVTHHRLIAPRQSWFLPVKLSA